MSSEPKDVTALLRAWGQGDGKSAEKLMPLIYDELRRLAAGYLASEREGHTLQPTALVHEAFMRLVGSNVEWHSRKHFFVTAARAMRRLLVDHARKHQSEKRGGAGRDLALDDIGEPAFTGRGPDVVALDDALTIFANADPIKAKVVELRFFGGLSVQEVADVLECSPATVHRHWRMAKAWLHSELVQENADDA